MWAHPARPTHRDRATSCTEPASQTGDASLDTTPHAMRAAHCIELQTASTLAQSLRPSKQSPNPHPSDTQETQKGPKGVNPAARA